MGRKSDIQGCFLKCMLRVQNPECKAWAMYNFQVKNLEPLALRHQSPPDLAQRRVFMSDGLGRNTFKSLLAGSVHFDHESVVARYLFQSRIHTLSEPWVTHLRRFRGSTLDTFGHALTFFTDLASARCRLSSLGSGMQSDQESSPALGVFRNWLDIRSTLESKFEASTYFQRPTIIRTT